MKVKESHITSVGPTVTGTDDISRTEVQQETRFAIEDLSLDQMYALLSLLCYVDVDKAGLGGLADLLLDNMPDIRYGLDTTTDPNFPALLPVADLIKIKQARPINRMNSFMLALMGTGILDSSRFLSDALIRPLTGFHANEIIVDEFDDENCRVTAKEIRGHQDHGTILVNFPGEQVH